MKRESGSSVLFIERLLELFNGDDWEYVTISGWISGNSRERGVFYFLERGQGSRSRLNRYHRSSNFTERLVRKRVNNPPSPWNDTLYLNCRSGIMVILYNVQYIYDDWD